ncbi:MAG TPA: hypothetical protein VK054_03710 [Beutenbergiaceae bacterium]|nr:hypothetical protein [Beutenbergiaceae bacterium]
MSFDREAAITKVINGAYTRRNGDLNVTTILVPDRLGPAESLRIGREILGAHDIQLVSVRSAPDSAYITYSHRVDTRVGA